MVKSLLDNDLYKFTMMQFAFHNFPDSEVEYQLLYRNPNIRLKDNLSMRLTKEIKNISTLHFQEKELAFLKSLGFFSPEFLKFLSKFSLNKDNVQISKRHLFKVLITGKWPEVILWEVIILALINEIHFEEINRNHAEENLRTKIDYLKKQEIHVPFIEYGTRRRFSYQWQAYVNQVLKEELPEHYLGTSNVKFAMDLGLNCYGTMGHEFLQAGQRIAPELKNFQIHMLNLWLKEYQGQLSIALSDVLSMSSFLYDFRGELAKKYSGIRVDSGNPIEAGEKIINFYQEEGIDPSTKQLILSDSLNFEKATELARRFKDRIQVVFGIGGFLTNDHGADPHNFVIKMTSFERKPVGKLTDTPQKSFCVDPTFLSKLRKVDTQKKYALRLSRDSKLMERAIQKLNCRFGYEITLKHFERPTIRNLAKFLEGDLQFLEFSKKLIENDLNSSPIWDPLSVVNQQISSQPVSLLLTGATGFLGSHLLYDLYQYTNATIYVLIRASSRADAKSALSKSLKKYDLPDLSQDERVILLNGDLSKHKMGLQPPLYEELTQKIDTVYHAASFVHHIYDYQTIRTTNVIGTKELISFSMKNKKKLFCYVSSIVAAKEKDDQGWIKEDFPYEDFCQDVDGYSQTKWVSEKLLTQASKMGLPVLIFRPSNITGRENDGTSSPDNDHLMRLIKGCIQMGLAPDWKFEVNCVPVDYVSRCIVEASLNRASLKNVFHIINENPLHWLDLIRFLKDYGYNIKIISDEEWSEIYLPNIQRENALFPLAGLYSNRKSGVEIYSWEEELSLGLNEKYRYELGSNLIKKVCPPMNSLLLKVYFDYLLRCQYLSPPSMGYGAKNFLRTQ